MIPTLLLVGFVLGMLPRDRVSVWPVAAVVGMAVLWGVGVGVADSSATTAVGGALLALANLVVGLAVGATGRAIARVVAFWRGRASF